MKSFFFAAKQHKALLRTLCFRHTEEMIKKLESAGLGYHVRADETEERLGRICMRGSY